MVTTVEPRYIESSTAARMLNVSVGALIKWERLGKIAPPLRTLGGRRLFTVEQIEEIRARREAQQEAAPPRDAA